MRVDLTTRLLFLFGGLSLSLFPMVAFAQPQSVDCDLTPDTSDGPVLIVTAPASGTTLAPGSLTIGGAAFDCAADFGMGVSQVAVYLGPRDAGGVHLGEATLRGPNPIRVVPADQYTAVGWTLTVDVPLQPGQNQLYVYARSDVNGRETMATLPVVGEAPPAPTAVPEIVVPSPAPTAAPEVVVPPPDDTATTAVVIDSETLPTTTDEPPSE
jgi:hypothetical protein